MAVVSNAVTELQKVGMDEVFEVVTKVRLSLSSTVGLLNSLKLAKIGYNEFCESEEVADLFDRIEELTAALNNFTTLGGGEEEDWSGYY
jgi:hypothetical protein